MSEQPANSLRANVTPPPTPTPDVATLSREDRLSLKRTADFFRQNYDNAMALRRPHGIAWVMVQSFLRGVHYFRIDAHGAWSPIARKKDEHRATTPVMRSLFRHALGFYNSNEVGASVIPVATSSKDLYKGERDQAILDHWIRETDYEDVADWGYQLLMTEGMYGEYRYLDAFQQQAMVHMLPASELFPIPYDARNPRELHGLQHATIVTKSWLEQQDRLYAQFVGHDKFPKMADKSGQRYSSMRVDLPSVGAMGTKGRFDGALVFTIWMKPTPERPFGEYFFQVGEDIFRWAWQPNDLRPIMPDRKIPVEIVYFDKVPNDFWGYGMCESVLTSQLASDRSATILERNARYNRPYTFYSPDRVSTDDMRMEDMALIPLKEQAYDMGRTQPPVFHFPMRQVGRDVGIVMDMALKFADMGAGFRSGVVFGQSEGRTDSGQAYSQLNQNAMASHISAMKRIVKARSRTFEGILDLLQIAWPNQKTVQVVGSGRIGRELVIEKGGEPWSKGVMVTAKPMLPGGRQALASILFQLRQMPGQDGVAGSAIPEREFRRSLAELNLLPPGIELSDKPESRIRTRINLLINDGKQPAIRPSDPRVDDPRMRMENHVLAVEMLKEVILDETFLSYSPIVQMALKAQAQFHMQYTMNGTEHPNVVDDDLEKLDSLQQENYLHLAEQDIETSEGEFVNDLPFVA